MTTRRNPTPPGRRLVNRGDGFTLAGAPPPPEPRVQVRCRHCGRTIAEAFVNLTGAAQWVAPPSRDPATNPHQLDLVVHRVEACRCPSCESATTVGHLAILAALAGRSSGVVTIRA